MSDLLGYKGYHTRIEYDRNEDALFGSLEGIEDKIIFQGKSIEEFKKRFYTAVDDYIELCREVGKEPQKAYKGCFNVRVDPDLHKALALIAIEQRTTLNDVVSKALAEYSTEYDIEANYGAVFVAEELTPITSTHLEDAGKVLQFNSHANEIYASRPVFSKKSMITLNSTGSRNSIPKEDFAIEV